ncbi:DUF4157 domain-containing protein [Salipiger sp. H15]|uniref:DUF4157 domain-containing protein n=1 Tax=Alloyangia sp. H15 TaxID=3029062 RepID=A0AAU8AL99_9RHOB
MSGVLDIAAAEAVAVQRACSCGGSGCAACAAEEQLGIQPKLTLGPVNDRYEQEADRIADKVVSGGATVQPLRVTPLVQRSGGEEDELQAKPAQGQRMEGAGDEEELRAKSLPSARRPGAAPLTAAAEAVSGSGRGLSASERGYFEPRFGRDLSHVRLHTGGAAGRAAAGINARAFTLRSNIAFAQGQLAPGSTEGRRLLAHEITHTLQQGTGQQGTGQQGTGARRSVQRQEAASPAGQTGTAPPQTAPGAAPPPATPPAQQSGDRDGHVDQRYPCARADCGARLLTVESDFTEAQSRVSAAVAALASRPYEAGTTRALEWYFNDQSEETVRTVRERLECIGACLRLALRSGQYGCVASHGTANAYVAHISTPYCSDNRARICLTDNYFDLGDDRRPRTLVHECAHRIGMSLGEDHNSVSDIYEHRMRFRFLDTEQALQNSDSFSMFVEAIHSGVPIDVSLSAVSLNPNLAVGTAVPGSGAPTWIVRHYAGVQLDHPVLGFFSPTLGLGFSLIGETETEGAAPVRSPSSFIGSVLPGVRFGNPRPGSGGGAFVSVAGGPALALPLDGSSGARLGAEAGVSFGYRWRLWDVTVEASGNLGYVYDPTREAGMEHLFTPTVGLRVDYLSPL